MSGAYSEMYPVYHTASEEKTVDELQALLQRRGGISRLQMYGQPGDTLWLRTENGVECCALLERVSNRKAGSYMKLNVKMEEYYRYYLADLGFYYAENTDNRINYGFWSS